jgi:hypothetical protein
MKYLSRYASLFEKTNLRIFLRDGKSELREEKKCSIEIESQNKSELAREREEKCRSNNFLYI